MVRTRPQRRMNMAHFAICDDPPMWQLGASPLELVVRSTVIYLVFLGALRLSGKRDVGQFTLVDLALVLLAANALQPAIRGQTSRSRERRSSLRPSSSST